MVLCADKCIALCVVAELEAGIPMVINFVSAYLVGIICHIVELQAHACIGYAVTVESVGKTPGRIDGVGGGRATGGSRLGNVVKIYRRKAGAFHPDAFV